MNPSKPASTKSLQTVSAPTEYISTKAEHEHILADENHCCLCGSRLNFMHKLDYLTMKVREDAHCPSCQIQMKSKDHSLQ